MKTNPLKSLFIATVGLGPLFASGCSAKETTTSPTKTENAAPTANSPAAPAAPADVADATWGEIRDCTYDTRTTFFAGFKRLDAKVDAQLRELIARRSAMPASTDTRDWDFAMKEMSDARSYLKGMGDELRKASPTLWTQQKEKVGEAWERTQDAYDKVKSSTTG